MLTQKQFRVVYQALRVAGPDAAYRKLPPVVCAILRRVDRARALGDPLEQRARFVQRVGHSTWLHPVLRTKLAGDLSVVQVERDKQVADRIRQMIDDHGGLPGKGKDPRELSDPQIIGVPPAGYGMWKLAQVEERILVRAAVLAALQAAVAKFAPGMVVVDGTDEVEQ